MVGTKRHPGVTSSGSRAWPTAPGSQPGPVGRDEGVSDRGTAAAAAGWELARSGPLAKRTPCQGQGTSRSPEEAGSPLAAAPQQLRLLPGRKRISSGSPVAPGAGA